MASDNGSPARRKTPARKAPLVAVPEPGSFADRWRPVNLIRLVRDGLPPREWHARSEGMLPKRTRFLVTADQKAGKSLASFVHACLMVLAGETVVILDKENGELVYGERIDQIIAAWGLDEEQQDALEQRLRYYPWPLLRKGDGARMAEEWDDADLVIFDSSRMFLTDLGAKNNDGDDYADFMAEVTELMREGISTMILDNTGHEGLRPKGAKEKGDINEVTFLLEKTAEFNMFRRGHVTLSVFRSRHGDIAGAWRMELGAGHFGEWTRLGPEPGARSKVIVTQEHPAFQQTAYAVLKAAGAKRMAQKPLVAEVRRRHKRRKLTVPRDEVARALLKQWAEDDGEPIDYVQGEGFGWAG